MLTVLTVLGARPQFIKASVVSRALAESTLAEVVIHTGQHFDANMSQVFFDELGIEGPAYNLGIHGGSHGSMTGQMLAEIERVLEDEDPAAVLVYGDTNSTLAGALAAVKMGIPVAHVEAGLRSFDMNMPEEVNRILTDRISTWLFTPTEVADDNLRSEGVAVETIHRVGDVMYDVAKHFGELVTTRDWAWSELGIEPGNYVLATFHRPQNTDDPSRLRAIVDALVDTAADIPVLWPVHPRTRAALAKTDHSDRLQVAVRLIEPVSYLDMVALEKHATVILTDSGGVQKEAFFHRVPCVTAREETEWTELLSTGWNRLAPPAAGAKALARAIREARGSSGDEEAGYGDGNAAPRIVDVLERSLAAIHL